MHPTHTESERTAQAPGCDKKHAFPWEAVAKPGRPSRAVCKRGHKGGRYANGTCKECQRASSRLNDGNVARHTLERLASFIDGVAGKRLTYKALIQ
jgi:hypothetical protein